MNADTMNADTHFYDCLTDAEKAEFAREVDSDPVWLMHIRRGYGTAGMKLAVRIHDASGGKWPLSELRPETKGRM